MRKTPEILRNPRVFESGDLGSFRYLKYNGRNGKLLCLFGDDEDGWEHVSVSPIGSKDERNQPAPTWKQMCEVKDLFWRPDETVVQFHPAEDRYIHGVCGIETNVLHLWKPIDDDWSLIDKE